jgi:hypothetical protein
VPLAGLFVGTSIQLVFDDAVQEQLASVVAMPTDIWPPAAG